MRARGACSPDGAAQTPVFFAANDGTIMRRVWLVAIGLCSAAGFGVLRIAGESHSPLRPPSGELAPTFVGERVCASCHPMEAAAWNASHHRHSMQRASESTVLGDFASATYTDSGVTSTMFRRDGTYVMRTDGPDGVLHDYEIAYTFGVEPLQQYLIAFPGGRFQSPELAWDSRPAARGGQRWFHLYPGERIDHTDSLHWTGVAENWNYMCADCHSTNVRKAWSAQTGTYATRFDEISVSCEACHGPGSRHVVWALGGTGDHEGLAISLDERRGVSWSRDPTTGTPRRSRARTSDREIEMCARCHSRRELLHEDFVHGQSLFEDYQVALLDEDLYYADGQIKGEVYEYGSFVQSRMYAEGVTCSDCHDPHTGKLRAPGDGVCLQCHAKAYAAPSHHFHRTESIGARCTSCHMPVSTYMVVDRRRDHGLRVPRPDLTVKLGVPNPCNGCHADRSAAWAARTVETWYGHVPTGFQQFAEALAAGRQGAPGAEHQLTALIANHGQPSIARASAIALLQAPESPTVLPTVRAALTDSSALVRAAAVRALADASPTARAAMLAQSLEDPVRAVRLEAATAMAGAPGELLAPAGRTALQQATAELVARYELGGDRPQAHVALATLYANERDLDRAEAELRRALAIDPTFVPASINLADLYRATGRDADAEACLREALARVPGDSELRNALGLVLVRQQRMSEALGLLAAAAHDGADDPRREYVYAVALHDTGDVHGALRELEQVLRRHPYDRDSLTALVAYDQEEGDVRAALSHAEQLEALEPGDVQLREATRRLRAELSTLRESPPETR